VRSRKCTQTLATSSRESAGASSASTRESRDSCDRWFPNVTLQYIYVHIHAFFIYSCSF